MFSGAIHSGKTTYMKALAKMFGDNCIVHAENIRNNEYEIADIATLRRNTPKYFEIQKDIITKKINEELEAFKDTSKIHLFDRSLIDSLFYYLFYVNKSYLKNQDDYDKFLHKLLRLIELNILKYNIVLLFEPIKIDQNNKDCYRKDISRLRQDTEFKIIKLLCHTIKSDIYNINYLDNFFEIIDHDQLTHIIEIVIFNSIMECDFTDYNKYSDLIEKELYNITNTIMNQIGVLEFNPGYIEHKFMVYSGLLFSAIKTEELDVSNKILELIRELNISSDLMDSRCYPTGLIKKHNTMIIGEAPGFKGRGLNESYLKPSFIFTKTSYLLRRAIEKSDFFSDTPPYITNLCKYAAHKNKITEADFKKCQHIIEYEIDLIDPDIIIALGNSSYNYIKNNINLNKWTKLIKIAHPASTFYQQKDDKYYIKLFNDTLKKELE